MGSNNTKQRNSPSSNNHVPAGSYYAYPASYPRVGQHPVISFNYSALPQNSQPSAPPLEQSQDNFTFRYTSKYTFIEYPECSICLGRYIEGVEIQMLECNHVYHRKCLIDWDRYGTGCPLCGTTNIRKNPIK